MQVAGYKVADLIHRTERSSVYRGVGAGGERVIIKTPTSDNPSPREIARYQWAFDLAKEADARAVVRHLALLRVGASVALVMEDQGGAPLATLLPKSGFSLTRWLDLSASLASALGRLHASGVVHRDINPNNVVVSPDGTAVSLIDLGSSTRLRRNTVAAAALDQNEGTLAYMSPEQCGRINSPVDNRSDLYSLGVTLFELACGQLPFAFASAAELAHAHVAREPVALSALREDFPAVLSDVVARLLAKNADDRYASAQGLANDLSRCRTELHRTGTVRRFDLGLADGNSSFRMPDRLYGREAEQQQLDAAIEAAGQGVRVFISVAGLSGIGKTALVAAARSRVALAHGKSCSGKFDQFQTEPYLGLIQALRALLRRELAEPEEQLALRRAALQTALGIHGQLLTDALPELRTIVGRQAEVDAAPPRDAERRLHLVLGRFLAVFATRASPLLLFLDDLQWADPASVQLIEALANDPALDHLLLVVGFRSNEALSDLGLQKALSALRSAAKVNLAIELAPLQQRDVAQLLADTLRAGLDEVQSLAAHIHAVAAGNPFFVAEFLHALRERQFFRYSETRQIWLWDLERLPQHALPDNVASLITERLAGLPTDCLDLMDTASCVGSEFDLATLASVHGDSRGAAARALAPAVRSGIIVPLDAHYKVFESLGNWALHGDAESELGTARYRFQHDRVRQTVHERLDDERQAQRHLRIGRLLIESLPPAELEQRVVEVFTHIVFGVHLTDVPAERQQLARVGLRAGVRAQSGLAFERARTLLHAAAGLLSPTAWSDEHDTVIGIHMALAQCSHALELDEEVERHAALVIKHARSLVHSAEGHRLRIRMHHTRNRYAEAVDAAVEVIASLGAPLPRKPRLAHVLWGVARTLGAQRGRDPLTFAALADAQDPRIDAAVSVLGCAASPAYFAEPNLLPLIGMACTRLSIRHGLTPQAPYGFAVWALVLCGALGRIDNGYRFGELARQIGKRYGGLDEARACFVVDCFVKHWKEPLPQVAQLLYADWAFNRDSGDAETATYCAGVMLYTHFLAGGSLDAHERYGDAISYLIACDQPGVKDCILAWVELYAALRQPELPGDLDGGLFSYPRRLPEFEQAHYPMQIAIASVAAGILDYFAGRFDRAEHRFALAARWEENILSQVIVPGLAFFRALNAYRRVALGLAGKEALKVARKQRARLKRWAAFAPFNLDHRLSLLDAEEAMLRGQGAQACLMLHTAVEQASGGALLYQALAQQRLASVLEALGAHESAAAAAAQASERFMQWGAPALAAQAQAPVESARRKTGTLASTSDSSQLAGTDLQIVFNAMTAISSEIDESALLGKLMPALMQAAGADRGLLLLLDAQGRPWVEAEASLTHTASQRTPLDAYAAISRRAVDLALRSAEPVVVNDASAAELLGADAHIQQSGVASILALVIALQGRTIGVLYLENHVARGAFTARRVEVTQSLGAQVGIALENARLYGRVQAALEAQTALTSANRRFVPREFVSGLGFSSIADVNLNAAIEREMNVLFVDLRRFSALSMQLGASATIAMINRYLAHVQPGIAAHGGFVGQYYGDGVLALFPDDADNALRGAMAMCRGLEGYNRERGSDFPELTFGMGLHSGPLTLGTIGDADHFQCCVVGDSVNLASRMEGLTKYFGATLVASGAAAARVRSSQAFGLRPLGQVEVAGRPGGMEVFECLACYPEQVHEQIMSANAHYVQALAAYRGGQWQAALPAFEACAAACAHDAVVRAFAARCRQRIACAALALPWDGIDRPGKG